MGDGVSIMGIRLAGMKNIATLMMTLNYSAAQKMDLPMFCLRTCMAGFDSETCSSAPPLRFCRKALNEGTRLGVRCDSTRWLISDSDMNRSSASTAQQRRLSRAVLQLPLCAGIIIDARLPQLAV